MNRQVEKINWIKPNLNYLEQGIDKLDKLMRATEIDPSKNEKAFHNIFKSYNQLLLRGAYKRFIYEHTFDKSVKYQEGIEPDFILENYFKHVREYQILEFKTPNEKFYEKSKFHRTLRKSMFKYIGQVKDYKDYLEDPYNQGQLQEIFGLEPIAFKYNLVVGRSEDYDSNVEVYERRSEHFNLVDVNIITFDDIKNLGIRFLNEMTHSSI